MLTIARLSPVCCCWRDPGSLNNNLYSLLIPGRWPPVVGTRSRHILILEIFLFSSVFWPPLVTKHVSPGYLLSRSITILLKTTGDMRRPAPGAVTTGQGRCRQIFYFVCTVQSMDQVEVGQRYTYLTQEAVIIVWMPSSSYRKSDASVSS